MIGKVRFCSGKVRSKVRQRAVLSPCQCGSGAGIHNDIMHNANTVEFTSPHYYDGCMKARNLRLIELADFCFCYWDKSKSWSGTVQTVGFALNKPIQVWNFYSNRLERK